MSRIPLAMVMLAVIGILVPGCAADASGPAMEKPPMPLTEDRDGQPASPPEVRVVDFKRVGEVTLRMHIVGPAAGTDRTAIVLFFCGSWTGFNAAKYFPQSAYFASRGALCFNAEVRSIGVHKTTPTECLIDAKSAIRWVRQHASDYGIDPQRIVAFGASAGGQVAACTALVDELNDPDDDARVSATPNALMLACPVLVVHEQDRHVALFGSEQRAKALSPVLRVRPKSPPALIMQGGEDTRTPPENAARFVAAMRQAGNRCDLRTYPRAGHGFHNYSTGHNVNFVETVRDMDNFLISLGILTGQPTIDSFRFVPLASPASSPTGPPSVTQSAPAHEPGE